MSAVRLDLSDFTHPSSASNTKHPHFLQNANAQASCRTSCFWERGDVKMLIIIIILLTRRMDGAVF